MNNRRFPVAAAVLLAATATLFADRPAPVSAPADPQADPGRFDVIPDTPTPDQPLPIMPMDEVRIGMRGYGLTVFHGTRIEPFPVEVVSIIPDFSPRRGTIWIRSNDPRLVHSGAVQGMSGSPIFLWEEGEEGELGEGGRLIGAFAYGYAMVKECLAGVQPIELMRDVGDRAVADGPTTDATGRAGGRGAASVASAAQTISRLQHLATQSHADPIHRFRLDAIAQLAQRQAGRTPAAMDAAGSPPLPPSPFGTDGVQRLLLPMSVGSAELAAITAPLLEPLGINPVVGGRTVAGRPPAGIDADAVDLAPGSVLSIPLAFGDADLAAAGTVTEVLPDGSVLGFGHAMFSQGQTALPMSTGYVHFVVPRLSISFKQSGSLRLKGTITRDETPAVVGVPEASFIASPMTVAVDMAGQPPEQYSYRVVDHPALTPIITVILAIQSLTAAQGLPPQSTLHVAGELTFSGGRTLKLDTLLPDANPFAMVFELLPPVMMLMNNQHENLKLEGVDLSLRVEPVLRMGAIQSGRINTAEVAPGEDVRFSVAIQPHGEGVQTHSGSLRIPAGLPEGDYQLMLVDAQTYAMLMLAHRPHRLTTRSVDDVAKLLQDIMSVDRTALYAVLQLPQQGIAVGRTELPLLPSSRRAMIATPTSTAAVPFVETVQSKVDLDVAVQGQLMFTVSVRERFPLTAEPAANRGQQQGGGRPQPRRRN